MVAVKLEQVPIPSISTVLAAIVAPIFATSVVLLALGLSQLAGWSVTYTGRGAVSVESCSVEQFRLTARVTCRGQLTPADGQTAIAAVLTGPEASFGPDLPVPGEQVEAYYDPSAAGRAFPLHGRPTELARLIVGVVPTIFLVGGTGAWLLGWILTRRIDRDDAERSPYAHRFPLRFAFRPKGAAWALFGAVWWVADRWYVDQLLGTVGLG